MEVQRKYNYSCPPAYFRRLDSVIKPNEPLFSLPFEVSINSFSKKREAGTLFGVWRVQQ